MTYFEYTINSDKLNLNFDISLNNIFNNQIYQESFSSFFNILTNTIIDYIDDKKKLHQLYKDKNELEKGIRYIKNLCRHKTFAEQTITVRGYNGKVINSTSLEDKIQLLKNAITYAETKGIRPNVSQLLERYEMYKAGWDTFYKIKIGYIPSLYDEISEKLNNNIASLKTSLKDISQYYENASDENNITSLKDSFKKIIENIKNSIDKEINIITMNFEAMRYEIGKNFSKLNESTANKVVCKNISDDDIRKNSKFVKEITYGDQSYQVYETKYEHVSAMNYGGHWIYVNNGFFKLPKGYQLAILYHEIGHEQCKHFKPDGYKIGKVNDGYDIPIEDVSEMVKRIRKDLSKFLWSVYNSPFSNSKRYNDGEEFVYLLVEWEADRFAANMIGKKLIKRSLTNRFSDMLKSTNDRKTLDSKLNYNYNMDRMKIRTDNI